MLEAIKNMLLIDTQEAFHSAFEQYFPYDKKHLLSIHTRFNQDILLWSIRKAFLWEYCADEVKLPIAEKLLYYHEALQILKTVRLTLNNNPDGLLFLCHNIAKIHYQFGIQWQKLSYDERNRINASAFAGLPAWLSVNQQAFIQQFGLEKTANTHAIECFVAAISSYDFFKQYYPQQDFFTFSYAWHERFKDLDAYSPWARMISIDCNHYLCLQENKNFTLALALHAKIGNAIAQHREKRRSESAKAITFVKELLAIDSTFLENITKTEEKRPKKTTSTRLATKARDLPLTGFNESIVVTQNADIDYPEAGKAFSSGSPVLPIDAEALVSGVKRPCQGMNNADEILMADSKNSFARCQSSSGNLSRVIILSSSAGDEVISGIASFDVKGDRVQAAPVKKILPAPFSANIAIDNPPNYSNATLLQLVNFDWDGVINGNLFIVKPASEQSTLSR